MTVRNKVLAGILALQAVVLVVVFWPTSSGPAVEKLFPGLEAVNVTGVTITDSDGRSIRLARSPFGCVLPDADDYPCVENKLPDFLKRVVDITTTSLVAETKASHSRLKVADDEFERLIELELAGGDRHRLYLGTSPRTSAGHVRPEGRDQVYLATALSASVSSVEASDWVDPVYLSVPQDQVLAFTQENSKGRFQLEKNEDEEWTLAGEDNEAALDQTKVTSLISKLGSLRLLRPLGKEELETYGFGEPTSIVTIRVTISTKADDSDSGEHVLRIGAKFGEDEGFVVKSSKSPYYVLMAESTVEDFIEKGLESLLEPPPDSTPETST